MNTPEPSKFQSSQLIEDLLHPSEQAHKNWLLTYLDVFVLIIMLFITLIAFSDLKTEKKKQALPIISSNNLAPPNTEDTHTNQIRQIITQTSTPEQTLPPIEQESIDPPIDIAEVITKNQQTKTQAPAPNDEISLQEQLNKKVEELGLVDSVNLKVSLGYAQLEIQDKILFHSSEAKLVNAGEEVLTKLVSLLKQSSGLIYIEGHTDNRPINTEKYPSNWELGAARATSVLHYLASQKLDANRLRAITYADTKPIADNNTNEGREKNRRVNLVIKISDKID